MSLYHGDLFEYEMRDREETKIALIVSADFRADDRFVNVIVLIDSPKGDLCVPVTTNRGVMYADCGMVSFATPERCIEYIQTVKAEEMKQVEENIARCLGIESIIIEKQVEVVKEIPAKTSGNCTEELAQYKAEAKIYKDLYEKLLGKVIV